MATIKHYSNANSMKNGSHYVTLRALAALIRQGEEIRGRRQRDGA